ncbi:MAG: class I SAM-dependent methyltransferase [Alphaproteobacteria bacterium]|nr:class I SAM-dependent methyltransferase [Alphaproteobacteria bacterium]
MTADILDRDAPAEPVGAGIWLRLLLAAARRIQCGTLIVVLPNGRALTMAGAVPGPEATLVLRRPGAARRILLGGDLGFAEAFMDGDCDCPDLAALVELAVRNEAALARMLRGRRLFQLARRACHGWRRNSRAGSRRNIAHHYDLGNAFYASWLDPTMTYSAAVYDRPNDDLAAAQTRKYERMCQLLDLRPGQRVLEIGCGWGGFAEHAARHHGVSVTGITLSHEQHRFAVERAHRTGLADRIEIRLQDYRDVTGRFDRIASIEMFEAVGEAYWSGYFARLKDLLVEGGRAALQIITIAEDRFESYRRNPDFIQKYIFPGGMLPSVPALRRLTADAGLAWRGDEGFATDYALTLVDWRQRFQQAWPEINRLGFDERFRRMWDYYLCYCTAGFNHGAIDVRQIALSRG